jgi:hypothetical protein
MQHIAVVRETEAGHLLARFDQGGLDLRIVQNAPHDSVCLRFIDPHGDTVINQPQLPVLIAELEQMRKSCGEADLQEHIAGLLRFLRASEGVHIYVRFIGD